jgi:dTDP-4-dehydrorhamnose 3,5-epimerase
MTVTPLEIEGSWLFTPTKFNDSRGSFQAVFQLDGLAETLGRNLEVKQVNQSVSHAGVIRGIHWADTPPGQAKYIFCSRGSIWDLVVDIREGSPTFGQYFGVDLDSDSGQALFIEEGLGHAFLSLEDNTVVNYLCSEAFNPEAEHGLNPLDKTLAIAFEGKWSKSKFLISPKDTEAPSLLEAKESGLLPAFRH